MFGVVAFFQVQEGKEQEFETILDQLVDDVRAKEKGNTLYNVFKHHHAPDTYVIMEEYDSAEAMEAHGDSEHFMNAFARLKPLLGPQSQVHILQRLK